MFFIAHAFKGQVHVFAGQVKIVSHSSSRTSAILKFFVPCIIAVLNYYLFIFKSRSKVKVIYFGLLVKVFIQGIHVWNIKD